MSLTHFTALIPEGQTSVSSGGCGCSTSERTAAGTCGCSKGAGSCCSVASLKTDNEKPSCCQKANTHRVAQSSKLLLKESDRHGNSIILPVRKHNTVRHHVDAKTAGSRRKQPRTGGQWSSVHSRTNRIRSSQRSPRSTPSKDWLNHHLCNPVWLNAAPGFTLIQLPMGCAHGRLRE
jgi:hypothetical protein